MKRHAEDNASASIAATSPSDAATRRGTFSWALYDWANSAFGAVIVTFVFATYFSQGIAADPVTGTAQWGWSITIAAIIAAAVGPILGAMSDARGRRKPWIFVFTWLSVITTSLLWYAEPSSDWALYTLVLVIIANLGLDLGGVLYNAMLNDLAPPNRIGRLSGWAWALGYVGGLGCLIFALFALVQTDSPIFGLDKEAAEHIRATGPLVAVWLAVFSLPFFLLTPDTPLKGVSLRDAFMQGLGQLRSTITQLRRYRLVAHFLLARMLYIDGLNTLFAFGGIYAAGTFGFETADVIKFGIFLNITSGIGAFGFAWLDDRLGSKTVILIALAGLILCGLGAVITDDVQLFWILGGMLGIFVGPTQAASRTLMARLAPADQQSEMFGLYTLSGKITAFLGPFVLGTVALWADSQRAGMATILIFLIAGFIALWMLKVPKEA